MSAADHEDLDRTDPIKRLQEVRKQARLARDDFDENSAAQTYAARAAACAESALLVLDAFEDGDRDA